MILQTALCNLKDELMESGYFNRFYEYAEMLQKGTEAYPQVYLGNGQYKAIYDFDVNGTGYIRKTGSAYSDHVTDYDKRVTSCNDTNPLIDLAIPLRLVAAVPKSKLDDNSFSDDKLVFDLMGYISKKQPSISNGSEVVSTVHGKVSAYQTDRTRVFSDEVTGIEKLIDLKLSFISIDFTLTFRASLNCIQTNCLY